MCVQIRGYIQIDSCVKITQLGEYRPGTAEECGLCPILRRTVAAGTTADGKHWWLKPKGSNIVSIEQWPWFWHTLNGHSTDLSHVSLRVHWKGGMEQGSNRMLTTLNTKQSLSPTPPPGLSSGVATVHRAYPVPLHVFSTSII